MAKRKAPPLPAFLIKPLPRLRSQAVRRFFLDSYLGAFNTSVTGLARQLRSGEIGIAAWETAMRQEIKLLHTNALIIAYGGGRGAVPRNEWRRMGGHLRVQYRYLHNYALDVQKNSLGALLGQNAPYSQGYLETRAKLYGGASRGTFYRGLALGMLPQVPGDGKTQCRCVTTPQSRVLTSKGLVPICAVEVGDLVLTHRMRWRPVLARRITESTPQHIGAKIESPGGAMVGFTSDHRVYTPVGWVSIAGVEKCQLPVYTIYCEHLQGLWQKDTKSKRALPGMPLHLPLWESKGPTGKGVYLLWDESQSEETMGRSKWAGEIAERTSRCRCRQAGDIRRANGEIVSCQEGWQTDCQVLGWDRQETTHLPLPVAMGESQWPYSQGICNPSPEWRPHRRQACKSGIDVGRGSREIAWGQSEELETDLGLQELRRNFPALQAGRQRTEVLFPPMPLEGHASSVEALPCMRQVIPAPQWSKVNILFEGLLPEKSALYDLTVQDDNSFIIEGIVAHNSNCKCELVFEEGEQPGLLLVFWELRPAEHCDDCVALSQEWNPYELWLPIGLSAREWATWLPRMETPAAIRTRAACTEIERED